MDRRTTRPGERARVPLERPIGLRFNHLGEFVDETAANLSTGGMFIRTRRPHPVGSVFEFEFRPDAHRPLIAGKAQVAWVRRRSDTLDEPAGMGVRFVELDDESRRQIAQLVPAHEAGGGRPAEEAPPAEEERQDDRPAADDPPSRPSPVAVASAATAAEPAAPTPLTSPPPLAGAAFAKTAPRRSTRPWLLLTLALAPVLAAAFWLHPQREATKVAGPAPIETPAAAPPTAASEARVGDGEEAGEPAQLQAVNDWARAWSEQRVDDYLAAYSSRFEPPGGLGRAAWESRRRTRIQAPAWIEVGLAFIELEAGDSGRSRVRFVQVYESDGYRDVVRKALDLEREGGAWKILRETVEP